MSKPAHIERMETEMDELQDRLGKLQTFVASNPIFSNMEALDQNLLRSQSAAMDTYRSILSTRINRAVAA